MKKIFLLIAISVTFNCIISASAGKKEAAENMELWSKEATEKLTNELRSAIHLAKIDVIDCYDNDAYKVVTQLEQQLRAKGPHCLSCAPLAHQFLKVVKTDIDCMAAFALGVQNYVDDQKRAKGIKWAESHTSGWFKVFRSKATKVLTDHIEKQSAVQAKTVAQTNEKIRPLTLNPQSIMDTLKFNPSLADHDKDNLEAAQLSLYALWDMQEKAKAHIDEGGEIWKMGN